MSLLGSTQYSFGSGYLYGVPLQGTTSQQTPTLLGTLQECHYDISSSIKELYGQLQFPVAIGRAQAKVTGKAKAANISALLWNNFFFGPGYTGGAYPTNTSSAVNTIVHEGTAGTGTLIPTTPFQITAAMTGGGTFDTDLGVVFGTLGANVNAGVLLTKVPSAPATGQYSVSAAGVYTFAGADNVSGFGVFLAYAYKPTTPNRWIQAINNSDFPMGAAPTFEIVHFVPYSTGGTDLTFKIYSAIAGKLSFGFKNTDFTIPELDLSIFANASGRVFDIVTNG